MKLSIGIVGLPNVGKSTLFKALTKNQVDASNYPFCTIDPNIGIVEVPDDRLLKLTDVYQSKKTIPTVIEFVDIAGLVAGAHKGEGLGNKFLSHIREVDAICQVLRDFSDTDVTHVSGRVDPEADKQIINMELIYADISTLDKRIEEMAPQARSGDKKLQISLSHYEKARNFLDQGKMLFEVELTKDEIAGIYDLHLLTIKPIIYALNVDEGKAKQNMEDIVVISAKLESELADMPTAEAKDYLKSLGIENSGLDKLILKAYQALNLITFFTAGPQESRAWTVEKDSTAPEAGSRIHTDFEEKFIRAEIINWRDVVDLGGELNAKDAGKIRTEGRDYVVQDGDVIYFRI